MNSRIATRKCPLELKEGIDKVSEKFDLASGNTVTSEFNSLFTSLIQFIEKPLKKILLRNNAAERFNHLLPSKLLSDHENKNKKPLHLYYQEILLSWQNYLLGAARYLLNGEAFEAIESLLFLVYELRVLTPKSARIANNNSKRPDKVRTTNVNFRGQQYCDLCWRPSERYKATYNEEFTQLTTGKSKQFCDYHNRNTCEGEKNYMRDQRYKKSFQNEFKALSDASKSHFFPPINWYCDFLGDLIIEERRKLAYELAKSGLNRGARSEILRLHGKGINNTQIAKKLGISRSTVQRNIKFSENKIKEILSNCYLDPETNEESKIDRQFRYFELIEYEQKKNTPIEHSLKDFSRIYYKVKPIPTLDQICKECS